MCECGWNGTNLKDLTLVCVTTHQVFGTDPTHEPTSKLPQHGFARNSRWEFMGKSTTESKPDGTEASDSNVKLDFGLSASDATRALWPYEFNLIYSVTLERNGLNTSIVINNRDTKAFEFEVLLHTYLKVKVRCVGQRISCVI